MKNDNLQKIAENVNKLLEEEKNNVFLIKKLIENEHLANKETLFYDVEYREKAKELGDDIQHLWNTIYMDKLSREEKQEIDDFLYNDITYIGFV